MPFDASLYARGTASRVADTLAQDDRFPSRFSSMRMHLHCRRPYNKRQGCREREEVSADRAFQVTGLLLADFQRCADRHMFSPIFLSCRLASLSFEDAALMPAAYRAAR